MNETMVNDAVTDLMCIHLCFSERSKQPGESVNLQIEFYCVQFSCHFTETC